MTTAIENIIQQAQAICKEIGAKDFDEALEILNKEDSQ